MLLSGKFRFRAEANQLVAVALMVAAVFVSAVGEIAIGIGLMVAAAVVSIGSLFWNAHRQDKIDLIEYRKARDAAGAASPAEKE
jgi:hypothetical protein